MKYFIYGIGAMAVLTVVALAIYGVVWIYQQVLSDPSKAWVLAIALLIFALGVIVGDIEWISDHRQTPEL
jgi:hypothetical protein